MRAGIRIDVEPALYLAVVKQLQGFIKLFDASNGARGVGQNERAVDDGLSAFEGMSG